MPGHRAKPSPHVSSSGLYSDEETGAPRGKATCKVTHSQAATELGPSQLDPPVDLPWREQGAPRAGTFFWRDLRGSAERLSLCVLSNHYVPDACVAKASSTAGSSSEPQNTESDQNDSSPDSCEDGTSLVPSSTPRSGADPGRGTGGCLGAPWTTSHRDPASVTAVSPAPRAVPDGS